MFSHIHFFLILLKVFGSLISLVWGISILDQGIKNYLHSFIIQFFLMFQVVMKLKFWKMKQLSVPTYDKIYKWH